MNIEEFIKNSGVDTDGLTEQYKEADAKSEVNALIQKVDEALRNLRKGLKSKKPEGWDYALKGVRKVQDIIDDILY